MDADRRLAKALEAANDALQHLSMSPDFGCLDCTHIDRLLARVVDLPTEGNQRNSRRNLLVIRQWMVTEGPGVVLLEVLGQLYWRLGELNAKQFEKFKTTLQTQQSYLSLIQNQGAVTLVIQRIRHIQRSKADACQDFLCELSDITGLKVESPVSEMDALRAGSSSPFTPATSVHSFDSSTSQETGYVSLIKYVPNSNLFVGDMEQLLLDFYVNGICPGRTVATQSNSYLSLLQIADACESTRYALLSLSASYIREYLPSQKESFHQAELYYSTQALQSLVQQINNGENYDAALATAMLLMHHAAVNKPEEYSLCWSCHANIFDTIPIEFLNMNSEPAQFMRTQLVLARTAQTSFTLQNTQLHSLETKNWFESIATSDASRVCSITGISPQLLFIISSINSLAMENSLNKLMYAQLQENQLQSLRQWSSEHPGDSQDIILATSEAFRLATIIYLRCRLYGLTRFNPAIMELSETLTAVLLSLPVKGDLYTAIYPVWPLFVACVTANSDKRECLFQRVVPIREGDKNTLPSVLERISGMRIWLANQDATQLRRDGWWDEMLQPSSSTTELPMNRLLCLG
ncbi:hypothetical protein CC80DRAFT_503802 [Byssothecium circinans]|uniref:Fungal-specific transcription factor domain-containing protein n=1 Tax=Byssothecium circinans TaxID=147558 RepID=A0A6A5TYP8_9PLEO|nr:hypothetical protein CC80DRAFT_503802 [Byssothecium circinans]